MKLMFDCREMARLISDRHEQTLEPSARARFRLHLVMCRNCRTVEEQMAFLHQAMRRLSEAHEQGSDPVPLSEPRSTS